MEMKNEEEEKVTLFERVWAIFQEEWEDQELYSFHEFSWWMKSLITLSLPHETLSYTIKFWPDDKI